MRRLESEIVGLVVLLAISFAVAGLGGAATYLGLESWYSGLTKPSWTPPDWLFGPVWSALYVAMAVAAWLVWRQDGFSAARVPLTLYGIQLGLNVAWSWLFFGLQIPGLAFVEVLLLLVAIIATLIAFWRRSVVAGVLLVPYVAWVGFASILNFTLWRMNV